MTEPSPENAGVQVDSREASAEPKHIWLIAAGISLAAGIAIISPFFRLGNASGHDFEFHIASWLEVARQWHQAIWLPRWHEWANHGFGEPRFIFYPLLSWILGAALGFVAPWNAVPGVFIVLTQTIAGLSAFALARRLVNWRGALFAAACYAANPYTLLVVYVRSDFAEQLASAIFPLLVLFAFEICGLLQAARRIGGTIAAFALVFAAVWLCNAPAGVLASYAMVALFAWCAIPNKNWRVLLRGGTGLALGLALAAFYLVPAAYEQKWVNIGQAISAGLTPAENFLYAHTADAEHDSFNRIASTIALLMMAMTALAAAASRRKKYPSNQNGIKGSWSAFVLIACLSSVLMWRFSAPLWVVLPKMRFVQFPWRWMLVLAVPYAVLLGLTIADRSRAIVVTAGAAIAAVCIVTVAYLVKHTWWDPDDVPTLQTWLAEGQGFDGTDEYDPAGDDHTDLPQSAPPVRLFPQNDDGPLPNAIVEIRRWTAEQRILYVRSRGPLRIAVRLLAYPAWRLTVNDQAMEPLRPLGTQQIVVPLSSGESLVKIVFERTKDRTVGAIVSWIAAVVTLALFFVGLRTDMPTDTPA